MKKRVFSLLLTLVMIFSLVPFSAAADTPRIKNIIYMIPDGGGYGLYDFANMVKINGGFNSAVYPNKTPTDTQPMSMREYLVGSMTTSPITGGVTDSGAAGTAMATGYKTINGRIGVNRNGKPMANLIEAAQSVGKATGLVSTYEWMHATPAAFSAHAMGRGEYYNLYQQIENKGINVVLGAGYGAISSYATIQNAIDHGYTIVENKNDLAAVRPGENIWGNIVSKSFPYDVNLSSTQANLAEMTQAAITSLSADKDGFFLMVEGSKVDTGGHANDAVVTTSEYLAFDAAFKVALEFAKDRTDTVIVCAPDHDTGGLILSDDMSTAVDQVKEGTNPSSISWTTQNHTNQNVGVWVYVPEGVSVIEGLNSVPGDSLSTRNNYVVDNTALAPYCASLMGVDLDALTKELFVDVTNIGIYLAATGKFTFNNGNKYFYKNQSVYYKDGEEISMGHKEAIALDGRVYVPAEIVDDEDWNHVTENYDGITGSGTQADPYVLDDAYDFIEFTGNMMEGETYEGKYIRQDADIDLAGNSDYPGIGKESTFAGTYDGNGHKINVSIENTADKTLFPYVTGTIMNLGSTGSVKTTGTYAMGLVRSLRAGSKLINCWSTADITAGENACGLAWSNYGIMENCYFAGTLTSNGTKYPIASAQGSAYSFANCYYLDSCGGAQGKTGISAVTETVAKSTLAEILNSGRASAAATAGTEESAISYWTNENGYPEHYVPTPIITGVTVTPTSATVNKGDGLQLEASVTGEYGPSQAVVWSIEGNVSDGTFIATDGYLIVSPRETAKSFTVMAKSRQDGSVTSLCRITVGNDVVTEPDGSRARPYLISTAEDFKAFSDGMINGNSYSGLYYKQTADIDMSTVSGYVGVGSGQKFAGTYDGNGYTINLDINSTADGCLFPYTTGVIMNLGTTGTVATVTYGAGICRSLRAGGKIINCWSQVDVIGSNMGGIAWTNYGTLANCYFSGTLNGSGAVYNVAQLMSGSVTLNNYWVGEDYTPNSSVAEITTAQLKSDLTGWLNDGMQESADTAGIPVTSLKPWVNDGNKPVFIYTSILKGDVDFDGKISIFDVVAVLKYISGIETLSEKAKFAATFGTENAEPAITHATTLLKYVARIICQL